MKIKCSTLITALLMAISVFVAEVGKTEYKSQMRKRKNRTQVSKVKLVNVDNTNTNIQEEE